MKQREPPSKGRLCTAVVLVFFGALLMWIAAAVLRKPDAKNSSGIVPVTDVRDPLDKQIADFKKSRRKDYQQIWADEALSQEYEDPFIRLWDQIRETKDKTAVLKTFAFGKILIGSAQKTGTFEKKIELSSTSASPKALSSAEWIAWLEQKSREGFELYQCEFHHKKFTPPKDGKAESVMAVVFFVLNPRTQMRYVIKGDLKIVWKESKGPDGMHVPEQIDTTNLTIMAMKGEPAFREISNTPLKRRFSSPVLLYDLDGDGLSEIVHPNLNRIQWNKGGGKYADERISDELPDAVFVGVIADFTGDGLADLLCTGKGGKLEPGGGVQQSLFLFPGDTRGRFGGKARHLDLPGVRLDRSSVITAGDIDGDRDLDVWVAQYRQPYYLGQMPDPYYDANDGDPSYLLRNDGGGKFFDATLESGLGAKRLRRTFSASFADLDDDGDLDLLTVNDFSGVDFYFNDGRGKFTDRTDQAVDNRSLFGMAHTFADFNLDGKIDIYAIGMSSTTARRLDALKLGRKEFPEHNKMRKEMGYGNRMYLATAPGVFKQAEFNEQVNRSGWSWGASALDFDSDGDPDIYIANGHISAKSARDYCTTFWCQDVYMGKSEPNPVMGLVYSSSEFFKGFEGTSWNGFEHKTLFMNEAGNNFMNVGFLMGVALEEDCLNVMTDDIDADGRPDLMIVESSVYLKRDALHVLKNNWPESNHWIGVRLREQAGRSPIGATITVGRGDSRQVARIVTGDSFRCQHANIKHFGLGTGKNVDFLEVRWLDGSVKRIDKPAIDRYHEVRPE